MAAVGAHIVAACARRAREPGYFPACQSCLDAVINEAQSSGGCPRASILANTVYGSDLLPEERSVDRSLTQA